MQYNRLGNTGLLVSCLGFGNMINFQPQDEEVNIAIIKRAFDAGINFFDTAEFYQHGEAEKQLGRSIKILNLPREKLVITTKVFINQTPGGLNVNRMCTLNRKHIIEAVNTSLQNLQLDYVDIVFAHQFDTDTPTDEIVRGFNQIIEDGKAFYWATSNWNPAQIQEAINYADLHGLIRPIAEQGEYHMLQRKQFEFDLVGLYEKYNYGTTIYSPLCGGFLTGKYLEGIPEDSRCAKDNGWMTKERAQNRWLLKYIKNPKNIEGVKKIVELAKELNVTPAQLVLAWTIRNKDINVAITGARTVAQLEESLGSVELLKRFDEKLDEKMEMIFENTPKQDLNYRTFQQNKKRR
ncbi:unnamed protein product [Paramecium primaurelia]|uniref:NADP-dependent oxidoreductase domain-containing protein n=1 Tax=Paramecium primaurelia TaxID=5886 RepID=A0A8S1PA62_PARPR|nr:unnamed protein product [Paramecium primaurelia]